MRRISLFIILLCLPFSTIYAAPPQASDSSDIQQLLSYTTESDIQKAIANHVYDQYIRFGEGRISDERYLISMMYLLNQEISRRLKSPTQARQAYFNDLHKMLDEIHQLRQRLRLAGIRDLDSFSSDLSERIKFTIDQGEIDFKKKKVFEDALQMLYVSEEMIKLDQLQSPAELDQKIGKSKEQLLSAFGETPSEGGEYVGPQPTIYDLFVEWKKNEEVQYSLRLADVKLARINLLKASSPEDISTMFNNQLKLAYTAFNYEDYDLAERLLGDLLESYPSWGLRNLDDLYFYRAESNFALDRLLHARQNYEELLAKYPGTAFLPEVYSRLVQINYTLESPEKTIEYANLYQNLASPAAPEFYDIQFLQAMAYYQTGNFERSIEALMNIPTNHPYFYLAQYFIGNAYGDNQQYDEASQIYLTMLDNKNVPPYIHSRALYKMGLMEYERGNYFAAVEYLNRISFGFSRYDKVLNALAWSHFEMERAKPVGEPRNFSMARFYAKKLVDDYYASPYEMEATGLLAFISQYEGQPGEAITLYRDVYKTKEKRGSIENIYAERARLQALLLQAENYREDALKANNLEAYGKAEKLIAGLKEEIRSMDLAEASSSGLGVYREANSIIQQIKELNSLRLAAEETGNQAAIQKIDSLQLHLGAVLESFSPDLFTEAGINLFDDYPVSKYVVEEEFRHTGVIEKRQEVQNEIAAIDNLSQTVDREIENARIAQKFDAVARLEQQRDHLQSLRKRYDLLLVELHEMETLANPYPEFNRWGDFGAFGIINVYFDQKQQTQDQLVKVAGVFEQVNEQLNYRKQVIEDKIKKIEGEVRLMTMKARMEERARLRAERERAFRESYFDTRESETPEEPQQ